MKKPTKEEQKQLQALKVAHTHIPALSLGGELIKLLPAEVRRLVELSPADAERLRQLHREGQVELLNAMSNGDEEAVFWLFWRFGPRLLAADALNPGPVILRLEARWLAASRGESEARKFLRKMGEAFSWVGVGKPARGEPESPREQAARSKAKARALRKFERYKPILGVEGARKQVLMDLDESLRMAPARKTRILREIARELRKQVAGEG